MNNQPNLREPLDVLLVEDNLINQKVAQRMLQKLGVETDLAINGLEALDSVKKKEYHLILMDLQMPLMGGLEATEKILEMYKEKLSRPKIIAITANVMAEDRRRCDEVGMDDFIPKPIQLKGLAQVLEKWFASNASTENAT